MGFREAKQKVIACLSNGDFDNEIRQDMSKNRLFTGEVGAEDVIEMVKACPGTRYEVRPHHMKKSMDVHIMRPMNGRYSNWYVKFYFVPNGTMFISVHPESEET